MSSLVPALALATVLILTACSDSKSPAEAGSSALNPFATDASSVIDENVAAP